MESDRKAYILLQKKSTEIVKSKKRNYITRKLDPDYSSRNVYKVVKLVLDKKEASILPDKGSAELAEDFRNFFASKIEKIRNSIGQVAEHNSSPTQNDSRNIPIMTEFRPTTLEELKKIIANTGIKSAPQDPLQ